MYVSNGEGNGREAERRGDFKTPRGLKKEVKKQKRS
jgi:hypothetical protein